MGPLDIDGHTITGEGLLTQCKLASYLIDRQAHFVGQIFAIQRNITDKKQGRKVMK